MPKFKLKAKAEKLDDIAELYRPAYIEKDGVFHLDPEKLEAIEFDDKAELAGVVKKEREARTKAESEAKKFDKFKSLIEDEGEADSFLEAWAKRHESGNGGKLDASKEQELKEKLHAKEIKKLTDQVSELQKNHDNAQKELKEFRLWTPLRDIATKSGLMSDDWELARLDLANKGQFGFDDEGHVVVLEDGHPSSVSPEKFFKEVYNDQRPKFYKASGAAGSGATGSNGAKPGGRVISIAEQQKMSAQESTEFFKAGGKVAA